jgi:hypothetical protein
LCGVYKHFTDATVEAASTDMPSKVFPKPRQAAARPQMWKLFPGEWLTGTPIGVVFFSGIKAAGKQSFAFTKQAECFMSAFFLHFTLCLLRWLLADPCRHGSISCICRVLGGMH